MKRLLYLVSGLFFALFSACEKDDQFITGGAVRLAFSVDTLRFDTVFTELGSATRFFKVYNLDRRAARIDRIRLESSSGAFFRLNIDGDAGDEAREVEILGGDSLYIFAEVTIDPNQPVSISPFVVESQVRFTTGDNEQTVHLEAWGQNANYFPSRFNRGVPVVLSCDNQEIVWDDPKPYVIYGVVFIDSCLLRIRPGTRIHVHGGVARNEFFGVFNDGFLYTLQNGRLRFEGEKDNPIVVQGDRLESEFQNEPGQWAGIVLGKGSRGNVFEYTAVKNAIFGLYVDSAATVVLRNSQIYNTASSGIIGFHSTITAENCLLYNNRANAVQLLHGGDYRFTYCTVASFGVNASALAMSNFFCYDNNTSCRSLGVFRLRARFINSIFFGSNRDAIILADYSARQDPFLFAVAFDNCIVKVDELRTQFNGRYADFFESICADCIDAPRNANIFTDINRRDYTLSENSIAIGKAVPIIAPNPILIDLPGNPRHPQNPDIGCFERQD
jgi:hypothetical protein